MKNLAILHGDVGLIPTSKLPENLKKLKTKNGFVVRHGESGHRHTLTIDKPSDVDIYLDEATGYHVFNIHKAISISHEEHKTLTIEPGIFIEKAEREYNPFTKMIQKSID